MGHMNMGSRDRHQLNQIIMEFYATSMNLVLVSRIPAFTSTSSQHEKGVKGKAIISPLIEKMVSSSSGIWEPIIIDIFFLQRRQVRGIRSRNTGSNASQIGEICTGFRLPESDRPILLERWTFHFSEFSSNKLENEFLKHGVANQRGISNDNVQRANDRDKPVVLSSNLHGLQMMMTILLRSLYCTTRLLPAQNLFRILCSIGCNFMLDYRISTSPSPIPTDLKNMKHHCFTPMDTDIGCMYISVSYQSVAPVPIQDPAMRLSEIISDYADNASTIRSKQYRNPAQPPNDRTPLTEVHELEDRFFIHQKIKLYGAKSEAVRTCTAQTNLCTPVNENKLEFPFAVDDKCSRMESPACSSSISAGVAIGSLIALLRSPDPLHGMHEQENGDFLVVGKQKKTASDALRELKLYIDVRDSLK